MVKNSIKFIFLKKLIISLLNYKIIKIIIFTQNSKKLALKMKLMLKLIKF